MLMLAAAAVATAMACEAQPLRRKGPPLGRDATAFTPKGWSGESVWQQKLWSNAGGFSMTGDAETIYLAAYHHGVQTFDGDGENIGAYVVEGTVSRVSASFEAQRLIAATLERHLYWLDVDGQMLWAAETPEDVAAVRCDPLWEWAVCGFDSGRIARLDWAEQSKIPVEPVED